MPDERLSAMPFYSITTRIDPANRAYTGTLDVDFTVSSTLPLADIYFRTYPNLQFFGGKLDLTGARVDGKMVNFAPAAGRTAVQLVLPEPAKPGSRVHVALDLPGRDRPPVAAGRVYDLRDQRGHDEPDELLPDPGGSAGGRVGARRAPPAGRRGLCGRIALQRGAHLPLRPGARCHRHRGHAHGRGGLDHGSLRARAGP